MAEEQKGVEAAAQSAPTGMGVETASSEAAPHDDPETRLKALTEELEKVKRDRDNYRNATLHYKGKKEVEDLDLSDPEQMQAYINKTVEDRLLASRESQAENERNAYIQELARKNKELALALANKNVISSGASSGSGTQEKIQATSPDAYWSAEQIQYLKARGMTDEQIKKAAEHAKRGA